MKKLIIFGTGDIAQLANFYFTHDSDYEAVAFTVDKEYLKDSQFEGKPVVPFEEVQEHFSPREHDLFIALSYSSLNAIRKDKYNSGREKGYTMASYLSSKAYVYPGFEIGENCFILEDNTIQPFVRIGNNVTLWSGNHIGHHSQIGSHTFIASHVVISGGVEVGEQCFIGVNATFRDHITIGDRCVIGAGALIMRDAETEGLYKAESSKRSPVLSSSLTKI